MLKQQIMQNLFNKVKQTLSMSKKKEPLTLVEATQELIAVFHQKEAKEKELDKVTKAYYKAIEATEYADDVEESMKMLTQLFSLENLDNGFQASLMCGGLVEDGYSPDSIIDEFTAFYKQLLEKAAPFLSSYEEKVGELDEEEDDKLKLFDQLKTALATSHAEAIKATEALDKYYLCGVAIFSTGIEAAAKGLVLLPETIQYEDISTGCYYLSQLLRVLYQEPVLVIDVNTLKGIKGKMSGVVDNFQLQLLLMGIKELNEEEAIPQNFLDVVKGEGEQMLNESITGKWNMYNWEYLKNKANLTEESGYQDSDYWIWSEGTPADISTFNGYTVILLGTPAYDRGLQIQRTFPNLKAEIAIDAILSLEEVHAFLKAMSE
jgi:hypothetical protein